MVETNTSSGETQPAPAHVVDKIKDEGRRLVDEAKGEAHAVAEQQTASAASFLHDVASAAHKGAEELKHKGREHTASLVDITAQEVDSLAEQLRRRSPSDMFADIEDFARRQPALVAGAAFLVGFGLLRFMKSSSGRASAGHVQTGS